MKQCFKCGETKPHDQFYKHPMMADGYLGKCKECTKADVRLNWDKNYAMLRQTDAMRRRLKRQASVAVNNALRDGRLEKDADCRYCHTTDKLTAHHWDYYRPFDVTWLCERCHKIADMARRDAEVQLLARDSA